MRDLPFHIEWVKQGTGKTSLKVRAAARVFRVVRSLVPDVLLVTERSALIAAAVFRSVSSVRTVPIVHGAEVLSHGNRSGLKRRMVASLMRKYYETRDLIICVSSYTRELLLNAFPIQSKNVVVVHNGIKNRFDGRIHCGATIRRKFQIEPATTVLLTIARLIPRKGQDVVIRALPKIISRHPDVVYMCVGVGPYRKSLMSLVTAHGLEGYVIFAGKVDEDEKYSYYDACDLFLMPSRREGNSVEGFGLTFLEAWHAAKPVLGGDHGGVVEVIDDGVDGVIVNPEDVRSVEDAVLSLVRSPSRMEEMGRRGREKAKRKFSDSAMVERMVTVLERP